MTGLDMELHDNEAAADLSQDTPMPNIWTLDDHINKEVEDNTFSSKGNSSNKSYDAVVSSAEEDELEKPSFLRRLKKRRQQHDTSQTDDTEDGNQKDTK